MFKLEIREALAAKRRFIVELQRSHDHKKISKRHERRKKYHKSLKKYSFFWRFIFLPGRYRRRFSSFRRVRQRLFPQTGYGRRHRTLDLYVRVWRHVCHPDQWGDPRFQRQLRPGFSDRCHHGRLGIVAHQLCKKTRGGLIISGSHLKNRKIKQVTLKIPVKLHPHSGPPKGGTDKIILMKFGC